MRFKPPTEPTVRIDRMREPIPSGAGPDLEELMVRYQQADAQATAVLIATVTPALLRFFASPMGDRSEAEDMLQEAWIRVHRARHTYRPRAPVLPWLYAIARHVRVDRYRRRRRIAAHEVAVDALPERLSYRTGNTAALPDFDMMIAALPAAQREVLTLLKVSGLSLEEVACATQSTVGAVKQKAHRAYGRLRALLEPEHAGVSGPEESQS